MSAAGPRYCSLPCGFNCRSIYYTQDHLLSVKTYLSLIDNLEHRRLRDPRQSSRHDVRAMGTGNTHETWSSQAEGRLYCHGRARGGERPLVRPWWARTFQSSGVRSGITLQVKSLPNCQYGRSFWFVKYQSIYKMWSLEGYKTCTVGPRSFAFLF